MGELQKNQLVAMAIKLPLMNFQQIRLPSQCCFKRKIYSRFGTMIDLLQHRPLRSLRG